MFEEAGLFALGLVVGFSGALAPGPTLVATIGESVRSGWTAGPKIIAGHILAELGIVALIVLGAGTGKLPSGDLLPLLGGGALIAFGMITLHGSRTATLDREAGTTGSPYLAGFLTSVANPYFWIWWFSVGAMLLVAGVEAGIAGAISFLLGHWSADLIWYTLVSGAIHRGRTLLPPGRYRLLLAGCGIFLILFGVWYILGIFR